MLEVSNLAFGFPRRTVGRDVSFSLRDGEVMCVLGPNGGGKTTLFRTLLGLLPPHGGTISLEGASLESLSRRQIAQQIGYVAQGHSAYFAFTVLDFVLMGRTAHVSVFSVPGRKDREVAERVLESLGIAALARRPVTEISGGERQLALVARALAQEPRLLVLDEPTASLDFGNRVRVLRELDRLRARGMTILFSTHEPDQALAHADRALLLADGRTLALDTVARALTTTNIERLYGTPVRLFPLDSGRYACVPDDTREGATDRLL